MDSKITSLQPQAVWKHFQAICQIPRPSGHLDKITEYIMGVGRSLGLETIHDKAGNVIIRKPATPGMENRKPVILQGHMDMVPQTNKSVKHNFETDPILPRVDGDWVTATETTLGADNGIGISSILAILESKDLKHGPLEALFTYDEETGMYGAIGLEPGELHGEILLNTDSEQDGELYMSCAGGVDVNIEFRYKEEPYTPAPNEIAVKLTLGGLHGGHSGVDIHLGRMNANKEMFRFLKEAVSEYEARLASYSGGTLRNAIPREAEAVVTILAEDKEDFMDAVNDFAATLKREYGFIEENLYFTAEQTELPHSLLPEEIQDDLINAIVACHNGVYRMIPDAPDVVETSSNLSIVRTSEGYIEVKILVRSSSESMKRALASELESTFSLAGARVDFDGAYPGWEPNFKSQILNLMKRLYPQVTGREAQVKMMHAGLECGIIGANYPGLDMISFGPTIKHPHSPNEKVEISTVETFWKLLVAALENIPVKE